MKQGNIYLSENLVIIVKPYLDDSNVIDFKQFHKELKEIIYNHIKERFYKNIKFRDAEEEIFFKKNLLEYLLKKIHFVDYQQFKSLIPFLLLNASCFMPSSVNFSSKQFSNAEFLNSKIGNAQEILENNFNALKQYLDDAFNNNTIDDNDIQEIYNSIIKISKNKYDYKKRNIEEGEILIVYDSNADELAINAEIRERRRSAREDVMLKIRLIIPGVNIEFFNVDIKNLKKQLAPNNVSKIKYMNSNHPLYHLASRVCASFVEYYSTYHCSVIKNQYGKNHNIEIIRGVELFNPCFINHQKINCNPELMVRKIMDVKDAIEIVGEGIDGNTHDYPPCPTELQSIFQGKDNKASSVRERYKFPFGIWFRGSSRVCNSLLPSLFRGNKVNPLHPNCNIRSHDSFPYVYDETSMLYQFMAVRPQLRHDYSNAFEWLCMAQHYSAPSRVLDWSENILIALYFAVMNNNNNCDSAVWALNAGRLNELTRVTIPKRSICMQGSVDVILRSAMAFTRDRTELKGYLLKNNQYDFVMHHFKDYISIKEVPDEIKNDCEEFVHWVDGNNNEFYTTKMYHRLASPIAVFPYRINERQVSQLACFTLYGGKEYDSQLNVDEKDKYPKYCSLLDINREANSMTSISGKPFLQMFIVPSFAKRKIREQLRRIGVHQVSMMPELENQAKSLGRQWCSDVEY